MTGVGRLLEVEARERTPIVAGSNLTRPGAWFPALKFRLGEREISRLAVVKNLRPRTTYGFRARAGVRTATAGGVRGSAARAVPEVFGPWSDESVPATTTATNEDDVASAKEARRELRAAEKAMRRERKDAKRKERKSKRSTRSDRTSRSRSRSASPSAKRKKRKKKRRRRESSSDDSETRLVRRAGTSVGWSERRRRRTARSSYASARIVRAYTGIPRTDRTREAKHDGPTRPGRVVRHTRARDDRRALTLDTPSRMKDEPDVSFAPRSPPNLRRVRLKRPPRPPPTRLVVQDVAGTRLPGCSRALSAEGRE